MRTRLANEYTYNVASPFLAAERGELDGIIEPAETRVMVTRAFRALRTKRVQRSERSEGNGQLASAEGLRAVGSHPPAQG